VPKGRCRTARRRESSDSDREELGESIEPSHPIVPEETERQARCCDIGRSVSELHVRQTDSTSSSIKGDRISLAS
jgi:hypothetical protein